ncbi:Ger(x)C family spore germination protein [Brevibacillus formosus]|uniref:Ger(x)C family spore germination protein n=1 Tax=Brevibacillus formosus TaxID=54913 RepID=UPI003F1A6935
MPKRVVMLLLVIVISLFVSGCWNRRELNELGIVIATAIDIGQNNQWVTSFQVVIPQSVSAQAGNGTAQAPVTVFSTEGKTLQDAFYNASNETPRSLFLAHNRVIVISEEVAKKGVRQIADFYLRHDESRETMDILLTKEKARKLLEVLTPIERIPGNAIDKVLKVGETNLSILRRVKLHEFISSLTNSTLGAVLPQVEITGDQKVQTSLDSLKETKVGAVIKLSGTGVFRRDRLAGWLNREESMGLAWISNRINNSVISFSCKADDNKPLSSFLVEKSSTKLTPNVTKGKLEMLVAIKAEGTLKETGCELNLKNPKTIEKLEEQIEAQIKKQVETTVVTAKKLKIDMLGFGDAFHKKYPDVWKEVSKNWERTFTEVGLSVEVKTEIRRTGMIDQSFPTFTK